MKEILYRIRLTINEIKVDISQPFDEEKHCKAKVCHEHLPSLKTKLVMGMVTSIFCQRLVELHKKYLCC